jgi:hypothetical protein
MRALLNISTPLKCPKSKYYFLIAAALLLQGCLGTRHLADGELMVYKQKVKAPRHISKSTMLGLTKIETNRKFLGLPVHLLTEVYYLGKRHYHPEKLALRKERKLKKIDEKISKTTRLKRINNLQFHKQQVQTKFDNRIENGNLVMQWGEPLVILDSTKVEQAALTAVTSTPALPTRFCPHLLAGRAPLPITFIPVLFMYWTRFSIPIPIPS